jgi:hypothetical protein
MMPARPLDTRSNAHRLCWLLAYSADARIATPDCRVITTKRPKISSLKTPAARSRLISQSDNEAKRVSLPLHFFTRTPELAAKSP